ncbi:MAG: PRC-barrel domain-containing protein, partial [Bacilli bacterium]|nr:PRC-barrel domain-containing protein [Bacilli bacterium]
VYIERRGRVIVDVLVEENGNIQKLVLEERKGRRFSKEEYVIDWNQIVKIGDDIILIDTRNK